MNETTLRNAQEIREIIVATRLQLYNQAAPCEPKAIRQAMNSYDVRPLPSTRTIAAILAEHGLTYGRTGWYEGDKPEWLPKSAQRWNGQPVRSIN